jgi:hypothetical protein
MHGCVQNEFEFAILMIPCAHLGCGWLLHVTSRKQCHWADGRIYKGDWVDGKAHGYGIERRPDGSVRHDGQWENDKPIRKQ